MSVWSERDLEVRRQSNRAALGLSGLAGCGTNGCGGLGDYVLMNPQAEGMTVADVIMGTMNASNLERNPGVAPFGLETTVIQVYPPNVELAPKLDVLRPGPCLSPVGVQPAFVPNSQSMKGMGSLEQEYDSEYGAAEAEAMLMRTQASGPAGMPLVSELTFACDPYAGMFGLGGLDAIDQTMIDSMVASAIRQADRGNYAVANQTLAQAQGEAQKQQGTDPAGFAGAIKKINQGRAYVAGLQNNPSFAAMAKEGATGRETSHTLYRDVSDVRRSGWDDLSEAAGATGRDLRAGARDALDTARRGAGGFGFGVGAVAAVAALAYFALRR